MWGGRALGALSGSRLSDGAAAACINTGGRQDHPSAELELLTGNFSARSRSPTMQWMAFSLFKVFTRFNNL